MMCGGQASGGHRADADAAGAQGNGASDYDDRFAMVRGRLVAICTPLVDGHEGQDVVQDTYLAGRSRYDRLRDPRAFDAWVIRIAINRCMDRHRRADRFGPLAPIHIQRPASDRDPGLRELIEGLPARERTIRVLPLRPPAPELRLVHLERCGDTALAFFAGPAPSAVGPLLLGIGNYRERPFEAGFGGVATSVDEPEAANARSQGEGYEVVFDGLAAAVASWVASRASGAPAPSAVAVGVGAVLASAGGAAILAVYAVMLPVASCPWRG